jgi:transposase
MAHGINANGVHRWRQLARQERAAAAVSVATTAAVASPNEFVAVVLKPALLAPRAAQQAAAVSPDIRIQVRRGTTAVTITWPVVAASQCAAWMRELLA